MEVKPLNSMGSLQPWLQVVRAVNPSASSQVTRKPCFEYDSVLLFENSSIDRVGRFWLLIFPFLGGSFASVQTSRTGPFSET